MKKSKHLILFTQAARHLVGKRNTNTIAEHAMLVTPVPNKEGRYAFPDGEIYMRIPDLKEAGGITIIHSGYPDPNGGLIELYMMLDIIRQFRKNRMGRIEIIFASMPYARQDNSYYDGEINAAQTLIETLTHLKGVSLITTLDAHFAKESWTKNWPLVNVQVATSLMADVRRKYPDIVFMAPDAGSKRRSGIKSGTKKTRVNSYNVSVEANDEFRHQVCGKTVGVVDDILSTGATLQYFLAEAKRDGAEKVIALVTHGVNQLGINLTKATFDDLFLTNTIDRPEANISIINSLWRLIEKSVRNEK